jgi:hypothetical protein
LFANEHPACSIGSTRLKLANVLLRIARARLGKEAAIASSDGTANRSLAVFVQRVSKIVCEQGCILPGAEAQVS